MDTHQTLTPHSQTLWLYGTSDVDTLNARFANDSKALGYALQLHAVALLDTILIVYLPADPASEDRLQIMNLGLV
jgi:hypothetical protein